MRPQGRRPGLACRRSRYSEGVSARHRGKPDAPRMTLLAVVALPLAGIGFIIYLGVRHPSAILILLAAANGVIVVQVAHRLVLHLANQQLRSAEQVADRLSLIAQLIGALVVALAAIAQVRGWMHGMIRDVVAGLSALYLIGSPVYWLGGKRRLIAVLRAWGAGDGTAS